MSERSAAHHFRTDRKTVSKFLKHSVPPRYRRGSPPARPKLDPFTGIIDQIFQEYKTRIKKQRHTAKRIYQRLRDERGFTGGITIVTDYVRESKRRSQEVFDPLSHAGPVPLLRLMLPSSSKWEPCRILSGLFTHWQVTGAGWR